MDAPQPSSGSKKPRKSRKLNSIVTPLKLKDSTGLSIGTLALNKPSGVPCGLNWSREVCLELTDPNDAFSLRILREIYHPNILHLESVIDKSSTSIKICVDAYTHSLDFFVANLNPSDNVTKSIVRQIVEGIHELILNGLYHGNFNIRTTYFDKGSTLVKLANFQFRGTVLCEDAGFDDWNAVSSGIKEISAIQEHNDPNLNFELIEDLADMLKKLSQSRIIPLTLIKDSVLDHVYFWNEDRRATFFIYDIQGPLLLNEFRTMVEALQFIPDDWIQNDHMGLLHDMNQYRRKTGGIEYIGGKYQYVLFVSGCYTHERELTTEGVDNIITSVCPRLCLELVRIVRGLGYPV